MIKTIQGVTYNTDDMLRLFREPVYKLLNGEPVYIGDNDLLKNEEGDLFVAYSVNTPQNRILFNRHNSLYKQTFDSAKAWLSTRTIDKRWLYLLKGNNLINTPSDVSCVTN